MKTAHVSLAVALLCASGHHAAAQLPREEVPGTSPAGSVDRPTPTVRRGQPTPKPQIDRLNPSSPNLAARRPSRSRRKNTPATHRTYRAAAVATSCLEAEPSFRLASCQPNNGELDVIAGKRQQLSAV
jgi:hypothetical protein